MPELPEIETVKRSLAPLITASRVLSVAALRPEVVKHPGFEDFRARLVGRSLTGVARRGKYLLIQVEDGSTLVAHLRMTGRLLAVAAAAPSLPHTHVTVRLDNGMELRFSDTRRFGCLWLLAPDEQDDFTGLSRLGIEPLSPEFTPYYVEERLGHRRLAVKSGILDQSVIAGLGNIYADETLFAAHVQPERLCSTLSHEEWLAITAAIPPILQTSIEHKGTTFRDFLDGEGREGGNMPFLQVYGRAGQPCPVCGTLLVKTRVGGRGTSYCPACQR